MGVLQKAQRELIGRASRRFLGAEGGGDAGEHFAGDVFVNEQTFLGVAQGDAVDFGGDGDFDGHVGVGGFVDVDVADALVMFDDRNGGLLDDAFDQPFAAARNDEVDEPLGGGQSANGGAVGGLHNLHGIGRDARGT